MRTRQETYQLYITLFFAPLILFSAGLGLSLLFLYRGGELMPLGRIAADQQVHGGLYGTALHNDVYAYKLALAKERKPVVAIIGSSRMLTHPQAFFNVPMVNLGLMASSAEQLEVAVKDLLRISRPDVILIGVDFFWLNPKWTGPLKLVNIAQAGRSLTANKLISPYQWLAKGHELTPAMFISSVLGSPPNVGAQKNFGWKARLQGEGYASDGEWIYGATIYGRRPPEDPLFADSLGQIDKGIKQFLYGNAINSKAVDAIRRTIRYVESEKIAVVTVLPPLAPTIFKAIAAQTDRYSYVDQVRNILLDISQLHLDATDIMPMGGTDCEFIDGFHHGEVVSARILLALAESPVGHYLNKEQLVRTLHQRIDRVTMDDRYANDGESEVDYLKLGCRKSGAKIMELK